MGVKLWGGRFEAGPSEVFERFSGSLDFDKRLADADLRGSQAYARALEAVGVLTASEREAAVAAFEAMRAEARSPAFFDGASDEDVHTLIIRKLKDRVGVIADKIHTGRSRNDQVSLDIRLWLRDQIDASRGLLVALLRALLQCAERDAFAIVPGYTHTRRAQPVLWPHYLLAYFEMFERDYERFGEARKRVNVLPIGSGALAGSAFPFDREEIARDLGFDSITRNSMDVSGDRDFALDFLHAAGVTMLHMSRLAEDWILYSGEEYGWLELGDGVTSGSSMMPQKKNPDSLELIRGKCGAVFGDYSALFMIMKGLPATYNRDMQEDKPRLFDAADQLRGWRATASRFTRRTRSSDDWCSKACAMGRNRRTGRLKRWPRSIPRSHRRWRGICGRKKESERERSREEQDRMRSPQRSKKLGGGLSEWDEQKLPAGSNREVDPLAPSTHAGRTGSRAALDRHSGDASDAFARHSRTGPGKNRGWLRGRNRGNGQHAGGRAAGARIRPGHPPRAKSSGAAHPARSRQCRRRRT
jgi:argininosuccinate lyase